jgi:hypothetical protein
MFNRHLQILTQATHSCAAAYDYARIRRLVRLEAGLYRFRVADEFSDRVSQPGSIKAHCATVSFQLVLFFVYWIALWRLCAGDLRVCRVP